MSIKSSPRASLPASFDDYVRYELWRNDPALAGEGIGLVIGERRGRWLVRRVLKKSPAERAGLEPGSLLYSIDDYEMRNVDIPELQLIVRFARSKEHTISTHNRGVTTQLAIAAKSLRRIVGTDIGLGGGGYCNTCRRCYSTLNGWVNCGEGGCSDRCAVV